MINQELLAPCGLYCGVCGIYCASESGDEALKEKMAKAYGDTPDKISCKGCRSASPYWYCAVFSILLLRASLISSTMSPMPTFATLRYFKNCCFAG